MNKYIFGVVLVSLTTVTFNVSAIPVSADWKNIDDGLITYDEATGLEWLDLSLTINQSYNQVQAQIGAGGMFEGWGFASSAQLSTFWDNFGGNSIYDGWSSANNGLFDIIAPLHGDLYCVERGCTPGEGRSIIITSDTTQSDNHFVSQMFDLATDRTSLREDYFLINQTLQHDDVMHNNTGSALIRVRAPEVPLPAAVWLFGTGLIGLIGFVRRKK